MKPGRGGIGANQSGLWMDVVAEIGHREEDPVRDREALILDRETLILREKMYT